MLTNTTGVILAGGKSSRMDGIDKGLALIEGQPLVTYVIQSLEPQVETILISANRNQAQYRTYGYDVIEDVIGEFYGPLSGILSAMQHVKTEYILIAPCDSPLLPADYAKRMVASLKSNNKNISVAHDGDSMQPVFSLISCKLSASLNEYLESGKRKVADWILQQSPAIADFSDCPDIFFNMNTPEDKLQLETLLSTTNKNPC
jgi:molybdenum cofactor guanylyltransferase